MESVAIAILYLCLGATTSVAANFLSDVFEMPLILAYVLLLPIAGFTIFLGPSVI